LETDMKTLPLALSLLALAGTATGADAERDLHRDPARDWGREVERQVHVAMAEMPLRLSLGDPSMGFAGRELEAERVVKGAPYCATAVHENIQALADGNRIVRRQQSQLCRDGEGRTRREVQREGGPRIVYLNDPVARQAWVLYPDEKRMLRLRGLGAGSPAAHAEADAAWQASMQAWSERVREQAARWKEWGAQVAERARTADAERVRARAAAGASGEPGVVIEQDIAVPTAPGASATERRRELRVYRMNELPPLPNPPAAPPAIPAPPVPPVPPVPLLGLGALPREGGTTTALPPREIDGLKVTGERTTWTIEAGRIGNEKPLVTTREIWRSPELTLTVQSREADPRLGEQTYRLEKIRRGEPDPALMKPPADYTDGSRRSAQPAAPAAPAARAS
jgi:hypothetical protein